MSENPQPRDVAVIVGSLRAESYNRKMAHALAELAPDSLELQIAEIGDLPMYNPDLDGDEPPPEWTRFRDRIRRADAVLFLTPEYNRSVPAVLKNAVDIASRPYRKGVWRGKPGAVASLSPGKMGAFGANHHLRQALVFVDVPVMAQPEAYVGGAGDLFDDRGDLVVESTRDFMKSFIDAFADWVDRHVDHR